MVDAFLRVITWNAACGASGYHDPNIDGMASLLSSLKPDVVLLQEVDRGCPRSRGLNVAGEIALRMNFEHHFTCARVEDGGEFGNAVLARRISARFDLALGPTDGNPSNWETQTRAACVGVAHLCGMDLAFASTHLASTAARPSKARRAQVDSLVAGLAEVAADRRLVGGDFNIEEPSYDCAPLRERYQYATADVGPTCSLAGPEGLIWGIDHLWIEPPAKVCHIRKIVRADLSDHCLVMVDLVLEGD